ncbi:MAG: hypothetical protein CVU42_04375 [Chloroflexi bacterium HGW-Chloroflexi-4]|nr:MAG: hypothetical protein CVU45_01550 [Chloroflexi bacterium HGW-Chloroflexi-7]PKO00414.1 MAG: hypothetical protein CVU42_04375 [Chloroflexi bacterium HGW-Chloroflexi-4]
MPKVFGKTQKRYQPGIFNKIYNIGNVIYEPYNYDLLASLEKIQVIINEFSIIQIKIGNSHYKGAIDSPPPIDEHHG